MSTERLIDTNERITLRIAGRDQEIKYPYRSIAALEKRLGTNAGALRVRIARAMECGKAFIDAMKRGDAEESARYLLEDSSLQFSVEETAVLFWAGLLHEHPDLTEERAWELMEEVEADSGIAQDVAVTWACVAAFFFRQLPSKERTRLGDDLTQKIRDLQTGLTESTSGSSTQGA